MGITETTLLESSGTPQRILNEIRSLGVDVAMDDFGTGYSSLSVLQSFPFTRVKIDRGFVNGLGRNPKSAAIVHAIGNMCRSLGLPITAEGVEIDDQRATRCFMNIAMNCKGFSSRVLRL